MTEIDNIFYFFVLPERVRARVEEAGRVELTDQEAAAMIRTKVVHGTISVANHTATRLTMNFCHSTLHRGCISTRTVFYRCR